MTVRDSVCSAIVLQCRSNSVKRSWRTALEAAEIPYFPVYNLRATFASRLSASGTPDRFVAQMIGHSSTSILDTYAKAIDEFRRESIKKLKAYRQSHLKDAGSVAPAPPDSHLPDKHPAPALSAAAKKPFLN
jgi:hypothetical protein